MSAIPHQDRGPVVVNGYALASDDKRFVAVDRKTGAEAKREDNIFVLWRWCAEQDRTNEGGKAG